MPGFETNRFIDLIERETNHLICSICLNIFDNAVRSECEHTFCKSCVQQWVESNHKECPECREVFPTRKRSNTTRNDNNLVIIRNFIFKRNLLINNLINEMKIKCDFDFNGCQQTLKLSEFRAHISECEHRFCDNCGLTFGKTEEHNCIELMKNNRNEFKDKYDKQMNSNKQLIDENCDLKTKLQSIEQNFIELNEKYENQLEINNKLKEENSEIKTKLQTVVETNNKSLEDIFSLEIALESKDERIDKYEDIVLKTVEKVPDFCNSSKSFISDLKEEIRHYLSGLILLSDQFDLIISIIEIGNFETQFLSVLFKDNIIEFNSIETNANHNQRIDFKLPLNALQKVVYTPIDSIPQMYLKITKQSCDSIAELLGLDDNSPNDYKFDVNSNDPKHRYIKIVFFDDRMERKSYLNCFLRYFKLSEPNIKFIELTPK